MVLKKTLSLEGNIEITDALHDIVAVMVRPLIVTIEVCIYKNATEQIAENIARRNVYDVTDAADISTYFTTVHATDNVLARGLTYLKDKVPYYSDAVLV